MGYSLVTKTKCVGFNGQYPSTPLGDLLLVPKGSGYYRIVPKDKNSANPLAFAAVDTLYSAFTIDGVAAPSELALNTWWENNAFRAVGSVTILNAGVSDYVINGKNLFNKNSPNIITGKFVFYSGGQQLSNNADYLVSDYIGVLPSTNYAISPNVSDWICFYDTNKTAVSGLTPSSSHTITIPSNVAFVRLSIPLSIKDTYQFEKGSVPTPYAPYALILGLADGTQVQANAVTDSLKTTLFNNVLTASKNLFNKAAAHVGQFSNWTDGTLNTNSIFTASDYMPVVPGQQYYQNGSCCFRAFYDQNYAYISGTSYDAYPVTAPTGAYFIRTTINAGEENTVQFEKSATPTSYTPYGFTNIWPYSIPLGSPIKWTTEGDSITAIGGWQQNVLKGMSAYGINLSLVNVAQSGTAMVGSMCVDSRIALIPTDSQILTCLAGTNDWAQSRVISTIDSTDVSTFYGAYNYWCNRVTTLLPTARIFLCTTTYGELPTNYQSYGWVDAAHNLNGNTTNDYAEAIRQVGKKWNLPVVDFNQDGGWNHNNVYSYIDSSGLHPISNGLGYLRMSNITVKKFRDLIN